MRSARPVLQSVLARAAGRLEVCHSCNEGAQNGGRNERHMALVRRSGSGTARLFSRAYSCGMTDVGSSGCFRQRQGRRTGDGPQLSYGSNTIVWRVLLLLFGDNWKCHRKTNWPKTTFPDFWLFSPLRCDKSVSGATTGPRRPDIM